MTYDRLQVPFFGRKDVTFELCRICGLSCEPIVEACKGASRTVFFIPHAFFCCPYDAIGVRDKVSVLHDAGAKAAVSKYIFCQDPVHINQLLQTEIWLRQHKTHDLTLSPMYIVLRLFD